MSTEDENATKVDDTKIATIEIKIKALDDKLSTTETNVKNRVDALDEKLVAAESDTKERLKIVDGKLSTSETDVKARVDALDEKLVAAESDTTERLKVVDGKLSTSETDVKARVDALDEKLVAAESDTAERLKVVDGKLSTSETDVKARVDALDEKLVTVESDTTERLKVVDEKLSTTETNVKARVDALDEKLVAAESGIVIRINTLENKLFDEDGTESKIDDLVEKLFAEDGAESRIDDLDKKLEETNDSLDAIQAKTKEQAEELENFFAKKKDEVDKKIIEYENTYKRFTTKIEELLPSAMSVGLASSYKTAKESFNEEIKGYTTALKFLYGTFLALGLYNLYIYAQSGDISLTLVFSKILMQLPFIGLLAWLTTFISSKLNGAIRLQQEYAHKEAVASSYSSFKQQIESIGSNNETELLEQLMQDLINSVSFNPSNTLDKQAIVKNPIDSGTELAGKALEAGKILTGKDTSK